MDQAKHWPYLFACAKKTWQEISSFILYFLSFYGSTGETESGVSFKAHCY